MVTFSLEASNRVNSICGQGLSVFAMCIPPLLTSKIVNRGEERENSVDNFRRPLEKGLVVERKIELKMKNKNRSKK